MILHVNDWHSFKTDTIITNDGFGMISIDYYNEAPETAFLHDFSVIPPARNAGMGMALLNAAIDRAKERNGFKEVDFGLYNHLMRKEL